MREEGAQSASFVSYNPTGLHELKCKWISDLCETLSADYICVQEHMRMSRTIDKYFSEQFKNKAKAISAELLKLNFKNKLEEMGKTK